MSDQLDFDPSAVRIGDTLKSSDSDHAVAFGVTDVDAENKRVRVYSPTMAQTVHRWVEMSEFSVHVSNDELSSAADREKWLNETLPQGFRFTDDGREDLEYVLDEDGTVSQQPVCE